ncbi:MAG TPA: T9SS type A sorting domain-containing protein, partial [Gemmatimonadota bacterium]|nr:T9SS type A sorting domain-containing protein [Gemmatimonadota bacterium]
FTPLRPLNIPTGERFFVIDSITFPAYTGVYGIATGGSTVWYHWETESGSLATDMLPAVGSFQNNAVFAGAALASVTAGFRADPSDIGPDLEIALSFTTDYGVIEDLEINGLSAHKGELGGTHIGEARPHALVNTNVADLISIGNARGAGIEREYSHPGPFSTGAHSYELTWEVSGGMYSGTVRSLVSGEVVPEGGQPKGPSNPSTPDDFVAGYNWGFLGPNTVAALRPMIMPAMPLTNTMNLNVGDSFVLFVPGQSVLIGGIQDLPNDGDVWTLLQDGGFQRGFFGREAPTADEPNWIYNNFNTEPAIGVAWPVDYAIVNPYPGMRWRITFSGGTNVLADADLQQIRVVPNPFIAANEITRGRGRQRVLFTNLPPQATIRIYTISGNLVRILEHTNGSGTTEWDVRTRFDLLVASGNYYYHVTTPDGRTHLGRFAVIN